VGALSAVGRAPPRFPLFAALWGFGLFAAYSIIKYKTPWLALSWLLPLAVAGGYAIERLYRARRWCIPAIVLLGVCLAVGAYQAYEVNFVHYDDESYAYVYAHTKRDFHDLIARMGEIAARTGDKYNAGIDVAVENQEYWPLPWYVRDYKHIGYNGHVAETNDAVILVKTSQVGDVESLLGSRYVRVGGTYPLRPGVDLALFGRRDLVSP
jgi:predicted membrane-bound mannosyltransferase